MYDQAAVGSHVVYQVGSRAQVCCTLIVDSSDGRDSDT